MNPELRKDIPEHCLDCPYIAKYLDRAMRRKLDLGMAKAAHPILAENIGEEAADAYVEGIKETLDATLSDLEIQKVRSVGCAGVLLVSLETNEGYHNEIICQSPLNG